MPLPLALYWFAEVQSAVWPVCCGLVSVFWAIAVVTPAVRPPPSCIQSWLCSPATKPPVSRHITDLGLRLEELEVHLKEMGRSPQTSFGLIDRIKLIVFISGMF